MHITRRLTVPTHTDASIKSGEQLWAAWLQKLETFMLKNKLIGRTEDGVAVPWATPKMHDLTHMFSKIRERGTPEYHSCNA